MVIFIEGKDGVGKTQIGKELSRELLIPYFKNTMEKAFFDDPEITKYRWLDQLYICDFIRQVKCSAIVDRGYLSDVVYTRLFRKDNIGIVPKLMAIDKKFADIGAKVIYCFKDASSHKDDLINLDKYGVEIDIEYEQIMLATQCEVFRLNTTDENLSKQIGEIKAWLKL